MCLTTLFVIPSLGFGPFPGVAPAPDSDGDVPRSVSFTLIISDGDYILDVYNGNI